MRRPLGLIGVVMLALALAPAGILAQDARTCPIFGRFQGVSDEDPNSDSVVVRYEFDFPAGWHLPFDEYTDTMLVYVTRGEFTLTVEDRQTRGAAQTPSGADDTRQPGVVVIPAGGPADANRSVVSSGERSTLREGDVVFQQNARYQYENVGKEDGVLSVSVLISRDQYNDATRGGAIDHEKICVWCILFGDGSASAAPDGATPQTAAKRLPAIQCRGG